MTILENFKKTIKPMMAKDESMPLTGTLDLEFTDIDGKVQITSIYRHKSTGSLFLEDVWGQVFPPTKLVNERDLLEVMDLIKD